MSAANKESTLGLLLKTFKPSGFYSSAGKTSAHQSKENVDPRQLLWAVRMVNEDYVELSPLFNGIPAPANMKMSKRIERKQFLVSYWPEPERYVSEAMEKFVAEGVAGYPQTVKETVRAYLPMVLVFLATGQRDKAETIIDFLLAHSVPMCDKQKKLLNRVAVELRIAGRYDEALECYASVQKYYGEDEHLHFNIARTLWDKRDLKNCLAHVNRCLAINPYLDVAQKFKKQLQKILAKR